MHALLTRIEIRQAAGTLVLAGMLAARYAFGVNPLNDLDGTFGLFLPLALGLMVPRSWLVATFWVLTAYFFAQGIYWLVLDRMGKSKSPLYWMGDIFAAGIFLACARLSTAQSRSEKRSSPGAE